MTRLLDIGDIWEWDLSGNTLLRGNFTGDRTTVVGSTTFAGEPAKSLLTTTTLNYGIGLPDVSVVEQVIRQDEDGNIELLGEKIGSGPMLSVTSLGFELPGVLNALTAKVGTNIFSNLKTRAHVFTTLNLNNVNIPLLGNVEAWMVSETITDVPGAVNTATRWYIPSLGNMVKFNDSILNGLSLTTLNGVLSGTNVLSDLLP